MTTRVVIALGGNALLRRGEPPSAIRQRRNVRAAAEALAPLVEHNSLIVSHGNGPQVGLLALQSLAYRPTEPYPLDILDAETEGMIGYLIEQELTGLLPPTVRCATLLTQIEVDASDPAFDKPTKFIGPVYDRGEAEALGRDRGFVMAADGKGYRRVVPSPRPLRIVELAVIQLLVAHGVLVICAGGGGIPVVRGPDGNLIGIEAVIDKDLASALLAKELGADALVMLTDVAAVFDGWGSAEPRAIRRAPPDYLRARQFAAGSMGPKVEAACDFVDQSGRFACIGRLEEAGAVLAGNAGTRVSRDVRQVEWWVG